MDKKLASKWFDIALPKDSECKDYFADQAVSALRTGGCFCLASIVQGMMSTDDAEFAGVEVPTTMIWGNKDWSHKRTNFASFRDHVPQCEILEFDGCGHFPYLERPKEFAVRVLN